MTQNTLSGHFEDTAGERDEEPNLNKDAKIAALSEPSNPVSTGAPAAAPVIVAGESSRADAEKKAIPEITPRRAAELAVEGRLAFRIRSTTPERVEERLRAVAKRFDWADAPQALDADGAIALGRSLNTQPTPVLLGDAESGKREQAGTGAAATFVAENGQDGRQNSSKSAVVDLSASAQPHPAPPVAAASVPSPLAFTLGVPATADRLERLVEAFRAEPALGRVELVEIPVSYGRQATPSRLLTAPLDPTMIIWWALPASQWSPRSLLPVLVEPTTP